MSTKKAGANGWPVSTTQGKFEADATDLPTTHKIMKLKIEKLIFGGFGLGHIEAGTSDSAQGKPFDSAPFDSAPFDSAPFDSAQGKPFDSAPFDSAQGKPVFVRKAVPGDILDVEITKDKKSYAEGRIKSIIEPSTSRIAPRCPHFKVCGGCEHQNIGYSDQLRFKGDIFRETLDRAGIKTEVLPIIAGSDAEYYYRNTMRFFFVETAEKRAFLHDREEMPQISLAMHRFDRQDKLIEIGECHLQSEWSKDFCSRLLDFINLYIVSKSNFFQLRIREGKQTGDKMVEIITRSDILPQKSELIDFLKKFAEIKSCYHTVSQKDNLYNAKRTLLFGSPIIYEKIGKFTFQISPDSFFQTNSLGIKTLYDKIKEFADIKIGERVLDLYCGTGTIAIYLSTLAKAALGVESVQSAINDAVANARINKVPNATFVCEDASRWLKEQCQADKLFYDKIIVDPPRDGLSKELIQRLSTFNFQLLTYTSCNPSTFARDIKEFEKRGLKLKKVQPVDMFPQTHHIECVGLISK